MYCTNFVSLIKSTGVGQGSENERGTQKGKEKRPTLSTMFQWLLPPVFRRVISKEDSIKCHLLIYKESCIEIMTQSRYSLLKFPVIHNCIILCNETMKCK